MKNLFYVFSVSFLKKQFANKIFTFLTLLLLLLLQYACNTTEPPNNQTLSLKLEEVSCTEAWLQLTSTNIQIPNNISLLINGIVKKTFTLNTQDSLLYIDSLLPNQTYKILATIQPYNNASNELSVRTMDTTSHNFTWQTFEFGQHSSSVLYDVAIIDENNIWAVGEIYMNDSLGNPDPTFYNAAHWDGQSWQLKRILYKGGIWTIRAIFAFNENDIWFSGYLRYYNGSFIELPIPDILMGWGINKIWGSNSNDIYIVGNSGSIAHYGGPSVGWQRIESGTTLTLSDIIGNDRGEIYACGLRSAEGKGIVLKTTNGTNWQIIAEGEIISSLQIFNPKLYGTLASIWIDQKNTVYTAGNIFYQYQFDIWGYVKSLPENFIGGNPNTYYRGFIDKVRGNSSNDMWIVGDRNTVRHFNGLSWQQIGTLYDPMSDIIWVGLSVKQNIVVIVGMEGNQASIMIVKK